MTPSIVSVFGSSSPVPGDPVYALAEEVGAVLAGAGHAVQTGGYMGTMEAVSKGAAEAGGHVIGVTSDAIEAFRPTGPNPWVQEEVRTATLRERLIHLTTTCRAAVVLPGGVGTLTELALIWNQVLVGELPPIPILTLGQPWSDLLEVMSDPAHVAPKHHALVRSVERAGDLPGLIGAC